VEVIVYLTDRSAWEQTRYNEAARQKFAKLHASWQIAVCTVIAAELLFAAGSHEAFVRQRAELETLRWIDMSPTAHRRSLNVMQELSRRGMPGVVGIPDLMIAATAETHGATVLHYNRDFERIAAVTGQPHEWIVPPGQGRGRHN
jgi:predicted nucleic acid-binding protein